MPRSLLIRSATIAEAIITSLTLPTIVMALKILFICSSIDYICVISLIITYIRLSVRFWKDNKKWIIRASQPKLSHDKYKFSKNTNVSYSFIRITKHD